MNPSDPARTAAQKADIWSCGVILYAMLYGCYPFSNKEQDYIRKIVTASYHLPSDISVRTRLPALSVPASSIGMRASRGVIRTMRFVDLAASVLHAGSWCRARPGNRVALQSLESGPCPSISIVA